MPAQIEDLLTLMIERSGNEIADTLMQTVMDNNLAPLQMTDDMRQIGLENTFMAGYFTFGSQLLQRFETPANTRTDFNTDPDPYNQTTPPEMGSLLQDIYLCSQYGGGSLVAAFPGDITQGECHEMVNLLSSNLIGVLIQAGLPEGTRFAHKHGWSVDSLDGLIHQMADAGIVYSPGGNYVLCIYQYHPVQLVFDPVNLLVADLSRIVYNYYNLQ
jgi:beta-lactamase class A